MDIHKKFKKILYDLIFYMNSHTGIHKCVKINLHIGTDSKLVYVM